MRCQDTLYRTTQIISMFFLAC